MVDQIRNAHRWHLLIAVLAFAVLPVSAAEQAPGPLPNPISAPGAPWAFDAFVVNSPAGDGWYSLAKDTHYAELAKEFPAGLQASAIVDAHRVDEDVTGESELLALIRKTQAQAVDAVTMKLVAYSAEPVAVTGASCARFLAKFDDRRATYAAPGMLIVRGVSCVRPNTPDWVITLKYIQRSPAADFLPELSKVGDAFLASLRLSPWDPSVLRQARVAVGQSPEESIQLLTPQAERGDGEAALLLGNMYLYGRGVARDYPPAKKWLDIAAKDGHSDALFNLGAIYDKALGVDRDAPQAVRWLTLAADQRDPEAQLNLALFYIKGDGVPKDVATAEQWLHRSADNGNSRARRILNEGKYKQQ
jgi:TPR repeat protein